MPTHLFKSVSLYVKELGGIECIEFPTAVGTKRGPLFEPDCWWVGW